VKVTEFDKLKFALTFTGNAQSIQTLFELLA